MSTHPQSTVDRRSFLMGGAAVSAGLALGLKASPASAAAASFRNALSISPFTEKVLSSGVTFTDGVRTASTVKNVQRLFNAHGANEMYCRVATLRSADDGDAEHGLNRALSRARLARDLGMPFNPELGLWAVYGDVALQPDPDFSDYPHINLPGPWTSLTINQMASALYLYGVAVAIQIRSTGVQVNVWNLGNEIEFGLAGVALKSFSPSNAHGWAYSPPNAVDPAIGQMDVTSLMYGLSEDDRVAWLKAHLWPYIGKMLAAVSAGIRTIQPNARFSSHISSISSISPKMSVEFWKSMRAAGYNPHQAGSSFYPSSIPVPGALEGFQAAVSAVKSQVGLQTFIAELGYPSAQLSGPYAGWNNALPNYPLSPQGQHDFVRDLVAWGADGGLLSGVRLWAPDYCNGVWEPMSSFTGTGTARPLVNSVAEGLS